MSRLLPIVMTLFLIATLSGCQATTPRQTPGDQNKQPAAKPDKGADEEENPELKAAKKANERAKLDRDLAVAERKLVKARLALEHQRAKDQAAIDTATAELDIARNKLKDFTENQAPVRLEQAKLNLKSAQDYLMEAEEELEQLELMYKEDDLADKTREIVIQRAKRRIERQQWQLKIRQQELHNLEQQTLPLEERDLRHAQHQKAEALAEAERSAEANQLEKTIAVLSAEAEVAHLQAQLAEKELEKED